MPIPNDYQRLEHSTRHIRPNAKRVGPADPNEVVSITIAVRRRPGAPALPSQDDWANSLPGERRYITTDEFTEKFGAAAADLDVVAGFAISHGLKVVEKNAAQRVVIASGKVSQVTKAFAVELGHYEVQTPAEEERKPSNEKAAAAKQPPEREKYRGYEGDLYLPTDVARVVEGVFGLDNRRMARRTAPTVPFPAITPLTPPQVADLYDFPKPGHHIAKETIGLLEFSDPSIGTCGYNPADINSYFTTSLGIGPGFVTPTLTDVLVNGATNSPGGADDVEVVLDIDVSAAVAQGAHIAVYFSTWDENGWVLAVKRAVHPHSGEPRPSVLSISWIWPEFHSLDHLSWTPAAMDVLSATFQEAAMFGMTVLAASGDNGSNCFVFDGNAHCYFPQTSPWVTTCGGTTIGNVSGSSFTEITWNDNGITGGGISDFFDLPHWQRHADVPLSVNPGHRQGRGIPDIAGYANGYTIVLGGFSFPGVAGTSEAAPLYAGLIALINAHLGERVGYLNPFLYRHHAKLFRDIADGRTNAAGGAPGYVSVPGWDACTGWGVIKAHALLKLLRSEEEWDEAITNGKGVTGKVAGLVYGFFGDFEGFLVEDFHGAEHRFESREPEIRQLVHRAWADRTVTTVLAEHHHPHRPMSIILRSAPDGHP